jgi:predicted ATPase
MRVVVTGGPGAGKTALLGELSRLGYATVDDTPRAIIRSRRARGLSPRPPPLEFAEEVLRREIEQYHLHGSDALTFFDRGVVDALWMVSHAAPERSGELTAVAADHPYHPVAIFLPPWQEIYVNDEERDHPFSHAVHVYESLVAWYDACGYQVAPLPKVPVAERCRLLLSLLRVSL